MKVVRRAFKYEEGGKSSHKKLVRECRIREVERQRREKNLSEWEERRRGLRRRLRISEEIRWERLERKKKKIEKIARRVRKRIEEMEKESRRRKIKKSK